MTVLDSLCRNWSKTQIVGFLLRRLICSVSFQLQLQQQMQRHADAMEEARLQSEGTIDNLRKKLNTLQEVTCTHKIFLTLQELELFI